MFQKLYFFLRIYSAKDLPQVYFRITVSITDYVAASCIKVEYALTGLYCGIADTYEEFLTYRLRESDEKNRIGEISLAWRSIISSMSQTLFFF